MKRPDTQGGPERWQPLTTQFALAARAGVEVIVVGHPRFSGSGLTVSAYRGARYRPAGDVDGLATQMLAALAEGPAPGRVSRLVYGYHPDLDQAGHL